MIRDPALTLLARSAALPIVALGSLLAAATASGQTVCDPATSAVGAHPGHTQVTAAHRALACTECHPPVCSPSQTSTVSFGALASARGAAPRWSPETRSCSGVYCHAATLRSPPGPVTWSYVEPGQVRPPSEECARCHGYPPPSHAATAADCQRCHAPSVLADGTIDLAGGHHIDGKLDFTGGGIGFSCDACHGFPPADAGHLAHFGLAGMAETGSYGDLEILQDRFPAATPGTAPAVYAFGCGNCHPLDVALHLDGAVEVLPYEAAAPRDSLKGRAAATAAYDPATQTCSGVYCHSSGQQLPSYVTTPPWRSGVELACDGCHANPPRYTTGAPGSATANTHLLLRQPWPGDPLQLYGHFTWHNRYAGATTEAIGKHGVKGEGAAPMTCQACHSATVDPASTGPSGFWWLDTTGDYDLPGARLTYGCRSAGCHTGAPGEAPQGKGRVLPLRHVNGVRDVAFDPRRTAPAYGVPAAPYTPDLPYWVSVQIFKDGNVLPAAAAWNPPPAPPALASAGTLSFRLDGARYEAATKTCSNVACHLKQASVQWGGAGIGTYTTCFNCHTNH